MNALCMLHFTPMSAPSGNEDEIYNTREVNKERNLEHLRQTVSFSAESPQRWRVK